MNYFMRSPRTIPTQLTEPNETNDKMDRISILALRRQNLPQINEIHKYPKANSM